MERFKQEKNIMKSSILENVLDSFLETTKELERLDEVDNVDEIVNMKKTSFDTWPTMFLMRGSDKIKYGELIYDFSIKYVINNNQQRKKLQEAVDFMRKVKIKLEKNNDKSNTQN